MLKSVWLQKASKLYDECVEACDNKRGGVEMKMVEAKALNELQQAIGYKHGIHQVKYKQAKESLEVMVQMVQAGQKTPPLTNG